MDAFFGILKTGLLGFGGLLLLLFIGELAAELIRRNGSGGEMLIRPLSAGDNILHSRKGCQAQMLNRN